MLFRLITMILTLTVITSCKNYKTPFFNDPLFRQKSSDRKELNQGGEPYIQRGATNYDHSQLTPAPNETYNNFAQRISNTLLSQEYEKDQLAQAIEQKDSSINTLKKQLNNLLVKHIDLRLTLMRMMRVDNGSKESLETLFKRYTIKSGDTLQKISFKHFGTYQGWLALYRFNREAMPYGPNRIHPGQIIYLPKVRKKVSSN